MILDELTPLFPILFIISISYSIGRYIQNRILDYRNDPNHEEGNPDHAHFDKTTAFFAQHGNPYFYFNYALLFSIYLMVLGPHWLKYPYCRWADSLFEIGKVMLPAGVYYFYRSSQLSRLGYGPLSPNPLSCHKIAKHYRIIGTISILYFFITAYFIKDLNCG